MPDHALRILFFAANPETTPQLRLDEEARAIREKVRASTLRDQIDLQTRWAARPDDLLQELNEQRPHIVHFSGHGTGTPGIVLQDANGDSILVNAAAIEHLFATLKEDIRVVVLNACYSQEQAAAINRSIDFVIAMSDTIDDETARTFAASFYRALGFGRSLQNAFEQGIAAIALHGLPDEGVPRLSSRLGADASQTFLLRTEPPPQQAAAAPSALGATHAAESEDAIRRIVASRIARSYAALLNEVYQIVRRVYEPESFPAYEASQLFLRTTEEQLVSLRETLITHSSTLDPELRSLAGLFLETSQGVHRKMHFFAEIHNPAKCSRDLIGEPPLDELDRIESMLAPCRTRFSSVFSDAKLVPPKLPSSGDIRNTWAKAEKSTARLSREPALYTYREGFTPYVLDFDHLRQLPRPPNIEKMPAHVHYES